MKTTRRRLAHNDYGFGLMEVVIVIGLISGLALLLAQIMSNAKNQQMGIQKSLDFMDLQNDLKSVLRTPGNCKLVLDPVITSETIRITTGTPGTLALSSIRLPGMGLTLSTTAPNNRYANSIEITKIELQWSGEAWAGSSTEWLANLIIEGKKYADNGVPLPGGQFLSNSSRPVRLIMKDTLPTPTPNGVVDDCIGNNVADTASSSSPQSEWIVGAAPADCVGFTGVQIQSCLDLAKNSVGGPKSVYIKAGTYVGVTGLKVGPHVRVHGDGLKTILQSAVGSASEAAVFRLLQADHSGVYTDVALSNLKIDLTPGPLADGAAIVIGGTLNQIRVSDLWISSNPTGAVDHRGVVFSGGGEARDIIIENNRFTQDGTNVEFKGRSIEIEASSNAARVLVKNNVFGQDPSKDNAGGSFLQSPGPQMIFEENTFWSNPGILVIGTGVNEYSLQVVKNFFFSSAKGVQCATGCSSNFEGNSFRNTATVSIGPAPSSGQHLRFKGNSFGDISAASASDSTFDSHYGIDIKETNLGALISIVDNQFGYVGYPISVDVPFSAPNGSMVQISNNTISRAMTAIHVSPGAIVSGNNMYRVGIGVLGRGSNTTAENVLIISNNVINLGEMADDYSPHPCTGLPAGRIVGICVDPLGVTLSQNQISRYSTQSTTVVPYFCRSRTDPGAGNGAKMNFIGGNSTGGYLSAMFDVVAAQTSCAAYLD